MITEDKQNVPLMSLGDLLYVRLCYWADPKGIDALKYFGG